ncbi:MAG: hypothetical protein HYV09_08325 [Deltaproteobacteria bacterium]|nr:hypothetical protein [Deltaproteobacteria bacterium]
MLRRAELRHVDAGRASKATIETTIIRDTKPESSTNQAGYGVKATRSDVQLRGALVERNRAFGVALAGSKVTIDGTVVRDTSWLGANGPGMGIVAMPDAGDAIELSLRRSLIERNMSASLVTRSARAGVGAFGDTAISLASTTLSCNAIDLIAVAYEGTPTFDSGGDTNTCGCDTRVRCKAASGELTPIAPDPPAPTG